MSEHRDLIVNDVTKMNPIRVSEIITPSSIEEIAQAVRNYKIISIGGGRYSMGGQTALEGAIQIDMRSFNKVIDFSREKKRITVQTGARWRDIQEVISPAGLSIKIMQTYSNFTVGGALSVNCHGRYVGFGPIILSVVSIEVVLADGSIVVASPDENTEIFYGCIGGYGGLGVIAKATLELVENKRVERERITMKATDYKKWFFDHIRESPSAIFHNGDIYPPHYRTVSAVTWSETNNPATVSKPLIPRGKAYRFERIIVRLIFRLHFGKQYRRYLIDPHIYRKKAVHWRNYEASYDVEELEPPFWALSAHILQEYFVPVERFDEFVPKMAEILRRYRVNALNVSIRHAKKDPGSLLSWAQQEVFAFVLYYKQGLKAHHRAKVAVWTRELIDAVLSVGGRYYLPYQPHATAPQLQAAYPRLSDYFSLKKRLDPNNKFSNTLLDKYYDPSGKLKEEKIMTTNSTFKSVYLNTALRDRFFLFLQNIYRLYPEDKFHVLITEAANHGDTDQEIYESVQRMLPAIKPFLGALRYSLPALQKQQQELTRETIEILKGIGSINGYMEIGTTGRYVNLIRKEAGITGPTYLVNDVAPTNSPPDLLERRGFSKPWIFVPMGNYDPVPQSVPGGSVDLITMFIGLHHIPKGKLDLFVESLRRVLRPGGKFILRDHDVNSLEMNAIVNLAHDVFNAGLGVPWKTNQEELRLFQSVADWKNYLSKKGFRNSGEPIFQEHDPTKNALLLFVKD